MRVRGRKEGFSQQDFSPVSAVEKPIPLRVLSLSRPAAASVSSLGLSVDAGKRFSVMITECRRDTECAGHHQEDGKKRECSPRTSRQAHQIRVPSASETKKSETPDEFLGSLLSRDLPMQESKRHRFNPWVGKSPGSGNGDPLQYPCLENPMDRGAWRTTGHRLQRARRDRRDSMAQTKAAASIHPHAYHVSSERLSESPQFLNIKP